MRRSAQRIALSSALVGTLVLGAAGAYAVGADLSVNGGARQLAGDQSKEVRAAIDAGRAKNVILLVGDGMGDSEITIARNYAEGAAGRFDGLDALPLTGQYTTYALDRETGLPDYVTDSAASGTGWATGTKTYNGAISVDLEGAPQRTLLQIAKANGLRTGDVSTAEIQDATPAVQVAHVSHRKCYTPSSSACADTDLLRNGGLGSITEQLLDTRPDVTLGGGLEYFDDVAQAGQWKGKTLLEQAEARWYDVVTTAADLDAVTFAHQKQPLLGLFSAGNMPTVWDGPLATKAGGAEPAVTCDENPDHTADVPTLEAMTSKAISLLDDPSSKKGFFLQVEGASIDKQDHAANPCAQIGETVDFDASVKAALDFAEADGNTLVIATADHAHSSQIVYPGSTTPGLTRTLTTVDGAPMTIAYGTAEEGGSQAHTGSQVRIAAYGPRAANVVGLTDQTDVFFTVNDALNLDTDAPAAGAPVIRSVNLSDGASVRGKQKIVVKLDSEPKYTYIELNQGGVWKTDNTKAAGSTNAGTKPVLALDTRDYPNGDYTVKIVSVGIDGRSTSKNLDLTIANR
ncbi:alkaline phosphatase [Paraoerskovia sediminicola]|uniref:Alkaline phosphatase n=1 Tax=Paraoerskovia sediminicola TaxID=1138587 RepID=A0ABM8G0X9_9CELL|nr:alkaline phosphatase [Paraoerskovia sediminicola]BDZ41782.1 alkaline phosphatase [Paraoerskovia sediminicola]